MKKFWNCTIFLLVLASLLAWVSEVCRDKDALLEAQFQEPREKVDVVFVGSSHAFHSWNPLVFYRRTGCTSIMYGSPLQTSWISYEYLKFALEKHHPKAVVFECYALARPDENFHEDGNIRRGVDALPDWRRRLACIERMYPEEEVESRYFPLMKYHTRWPSLYRSDFTGTRRKLNTHGFALTELVNDKEFAFPELKRTGSAEISDNAKAWLGKIKSLVEKSGAKLLVYSAPYNLNQAQFDMIGSVDDWCAANSVPFFNCNLRSFTEMLQPMRDMKDRGHTNFFGAEIVTAHVGDWLAGFLDRESDGGRGGAKGLIDWDGELAAYERDFGSKFFYETVIDPMLDRWRLDCVAPSRNGRIEVRNAAVERPAFLQADGRAGFKLVDAASKKEFVIKPDAAGEVNINLRGMYFASGRGGSLPFAADFVSFKINGKEFLSAPAEVTHDAPRRINLKVKAGEELRCEVKVRRHRYDEKELRKLLEEYCRLTGEDARRLGFLFETRLLKNFLQKGEGELVKHES